MNVYFCDACAKPRGRSGVCSQKCNDALALVKPQHSTRSGSKVIVPINSRVGQVFARICVATRNNPVRWTNYNGDFVLPASLVDGVGAHVALIGSNGEEALKFASKARHEYLSHGGRFTEQTLADFSRITPEMLAHVLPHLPYASSVELGQSRALDTKARTELQHYFRKDINEKIRQRKELLTTEKAADASHTADRIEMLKKRVAFFRTIEDLTRVYPTRAREWDAIKAILPQLETTPQLESSAFTPLETHIAVMSSIILSRPPEESKMVFVHLLSTIQRLSEDERRTTYSVLMELPGINNIRREAEARADRLLRDKDKSEAAKKFLAETPFLEVPKALVASDGVDFYSNELNLEGPNHVEVMYAPIEDKTIVLLGEYHMEEDRRYYEHLPRERVCALDGKQIVGLTNYIRAVLFQASERVDFFLEYHPTRLCSIASKYALCYNAELLHNLNAWSKEFNLRLHWTDIRFNNDFLRNFMMKYIHREPIQDADIPSFPMSLDDPLLHALKKQIAATHPRIQPMIEEKFKSLSMGYFVDASKVGKVDAFFLFLVEISDLYTLARMFKEHVGKFVICYGGLRHSENLHWYLSDLGCESLAVGLGTQLHCVRLHARNEAMFFFDPLRQVRTMAGVDELAAFIQRPSLYVKENDYAPRYGLFGLLSVNLVRYNSEYVGLLASYAQSDFDVYFTSAVDESGTLAIFVRSDKFLDHALTSDKTLLAIYAYTRAFTRLSDLAKDSLHRLLRNLKEEKNAAIK